MSFFNNGFQDIDVDPFLKNAIEKIISTVLSWTGPNWCSHYFPFKLCPPVLFSSISSTGGTSEPVEEKSGWVKDQLPASPPCWLPLLREVQVCWSCCGSGDRFKSIIFKHVFFSCLHTWKCLSVQSSSLEVFSHPSTEERYVCVYISIYQYSGYLNVASLYFVRHKYESQLPGRLGKLSRCGYTATSSQILYVSQPLTGVEITNCMYSLYCN